MKVLTFSTLFPNHIQPQNAIFVKHRMAAVSKYADVTLKVVAPVPLFPPLKIRPRWYQFSQIKRFEISDGIEVYHPRYLVFPKIGMYFHGMSMFLGALNTIRTMQREFSFDLIDAHYVYPDGFAAILLGKFFHKPVILSARGSDINIYPEFRIIREMMTYALQNCSAIISVSSSLKEVMIKKLGIPSNKICVIPNGVDQNIFHHINPRDARKKLRLPSKKKMIVSVGFLSILKGHHILLDAIHLLKERDTLDFHTYIIGEGRYRRGLEKKIESLSLGRDVSLMGRIPNNELGDWYNAADLFFLGSSNEGWPNVISEALACGTPVVATSVGGIPEILFSEDYGILVKRNAEDFAKGIRKALSKNWNYEKIRKYGQSRTWDTVASQVYRIFTDVLNQ